MNSIPIFIEYGEARFVKDLQELGCSDECIKSSVRASEKFGYLCATNYTSEKGCIVYCPKCDKMRFNSGPDSIVFLCQTCGTVLGYPFNEQIPYYEQTTSPCRFFIPIWRPIITAPQDGTFILGCYEGPWRHEFEQWRAPQTIAFRSFHPNAPGKRQWRDKDGKPVLCTYWMPLMESPHA